MVSPDINLKLVTNVVTNFSDQINHRRTKHAPPPTVVPAPESIAMLALGLLRKTYLVNGMPWNASNLPMICLSSSTYSLLLRHIVNQPKHPLSIRDRIMTNLVIMCKSLQTPKPLAIESEPRLADMPANLVIYTSIGLELLNSVVATLGEFMESPGNFDDTVRSLAPRCFANQPILCQEFWRHPGSIGTLVETSFDKSVTSVEHIG
jgi:hypothetical protein